MNKINSGEKASGCCFSQHWHMSKTPTNMTVYCVTPKNLGRGSRKVGETPKKMAETPRNPGQPKFMQPELPKKLAKIEKK